MKENDTQNFRSSMLWLSFFKLSSQIILWTLTFITIRILSPEDYGVNALVDVIADFVLIICGSQLASSIIQREEISEKEEQGLFCFIIIIGLLLFVFQWFFSSPYSSYYEQPSLESLVRIASLAILFSISSIIAHARLARQMRFKELGAIDLIASIIGGATTLALAYQGYGAASLVIGFVVKSGIASILKISRIKRIPKPSIRAIPYALPHIKFNLLLVASGFVWVAYDKLDILVVSKIFETGLTGYYVIALQLSLLALSKAMPIFKEVAFPVYSRAQNSPEQTSTFLYQTIRVSQSLLVPVLFGLGITSFQWVPIIMGDKWLPSASIIFLLCLSMPIRLFNEMFNPLLKGMGHAKFLVGTEIFSAVTLFVSLIAVSQFGFKYVPVAWFFSLPCISILLLFIAKRYVRISSKDAILQAIPPLFSGIVMISSIYLFKATITGHKDIFYLLFSIIIGVLIYPATLYITKKSYIYEIIDIFKTRKSHLA